LSIFQKDGPARVCASYPGTGIHVQSRATRSELGMRGWDLISADIEAVNPRGGREKPQSWQCSPVGETSQRPLLVPLELIVARPWLIEAKTEEATRRLSHPRTVPTRSQVIRKGGLRPSLATRSYAWCLTDNNPYGGLTSSARGGGRG